VAPTSDAADTEAHDRSRPSDDRLLIGIDGCRGGWVAAIATVGRPDHLLGIEVHDHIAPLLAEIVSGRAAIVTIDMPIGLTASGPRRCDDETRARRGPRASSVFATPPRPLLGCASHAEAVALGRRLDGRGISIQAFNLIPKIAQVDDALGLHPDPTIFDHLHEAHPESAFAELSGQPLTTRKRTAEGRSERRRLLEQVFGDGDELLDRRHRGAAADDVLDAAVLVRTAHRVRTGVAIVLGGGELDERGIPMRVVI
jgi:predicted RNase H-like nuclease